MAKPIGRDEAKQLEVEPWNLLADQRAHEIDSGADISFRHVLAPTIEVLLKSENRRAGRLIDIGCGTGRLFPYLAGSSDEIFAIDPSTRSIELAKKFSSSSGIRTQATTDTIQSFAQKQLPKFDIAVANMVLMDVVDLADFMRHTRKILKPGALLVATVTHPHFWPEYWGYDREPWFTYRDETFIRSRFKTSLRRSAIDTLHVHRPLTQYSKGFEEQGFLLQSLQEPVLPEKTQRETGVSWTSPHFLVFTAVVA